MKNLLITLCFLISISSQATIDESDMKAMEPKDEEVKASRSCFQELEDQGCRHPREGLEQFRTCMNNVRPSLSASCQGMMNSLYGKS